jgi:hypothetical protein
MSVGMGTSPERRDRFKRSEICLAMIGESNLKKKGSKASDPDVFWGQVSGAPPASWTL